MSRFISNTAATLAISGMLAACSGSPARIAMMSADDLRGENAFNLCNAYAMNRTDKARGELMRRNLITDEEWSAIETKAIFIGMSELALVCAWGIPSTYGAINRTTTSRGDRKQWVYRPCPNCRAQYVYSENKKVTAWQD